MSTTTLTIAPTRDSFQSQGTAGSKTGGTIRLVGFAPTATTIQSDGDVATADVASPIGTSPSQTINKDQSESEGVKSYLGSLIIPKASSTAPTPGQDDQGPTAQSEVSVATALADSDGLPHAEQTSTPKSGATAERPRSTPSVTSDSGDRYRIVDKFYVPGRGKNRTEWTDKLLAESKRVAMNHARRDGKKSQWADSHTKKTTQLDTEQSPQDISRDISRPSMMQADSAPTKRRHSTILYKHNPNPNEKEFIVQRVETDAPITEADTSQGGMLEGWIKPVNAELSDAEWALSEAEWKSRMRGRRQRRYPKADWRGMSVGDTMVSASPLTGTEEARGGSKTTRPCPTFESGKDILVNVPDGVTVGTTRTKSKSKGHSMIWSVLKPDDEWDGRTSRLMDLLPPEYEGLKQTRGVWKEMEDGTVRIRGDYGRREIGGKRGRSRVKSGVERSWREGAEGTEGDVGGESVVDTTDAGVTGTDVQTGGVLGSTISASAAA